MSDPGPAGEFWGDVIKDLRGEPAARLKMARENYPLPGAFREAAIATRALIRERRKAGENAEALLQLLYLTAAQNDFLHHTPTIDGIGPAFNVAESIPRKVWAKLGFPYKVIGYRKLTLLNKTDVKWLVAAWGEPEGHQTAQEYHQDLWDQYVEKTRKHLRSRDDEFREENEIVRDAARRVRARRASERAKAETETLEGEIPVGCYLLPVALLVAFLVYLWVKFV